jgi:signal transduction histidine kinase
MGCKLQLIQLFQNLVGNAIKYRRDDVPPRVHIWAREDGAICRFCVEDNGVGIKPSYHAQIFGIFKQLDRGSRGGVGVGLAISKRIVEQHGGEISVASNIGEGSRFQFTLKPAGKNHFRGSDL